MLQQSGAIRERNKNLLCSVIIQLKNKLISIIKTILKQINTMRFSGIIQNAKSKLRQNSNKTSPCLVRYSVKSILPNRGIIVSYQDSLMRV